MTYSKDKSKSVDLLVKDMNSCPRIHGLQYAIQQKDVTILIYGPGKNRQTLSS